MNYKLYHQNEQMRQAIFSIILIGMVLFSGSSLAQNRKFQVHSRGMLHQTVYNTGELGRPFDAGQSGITNGYPPSMEWPPNSKTIVDRKQYSGQHNSFGGGVHFAFTRNGARTFSYCGAVSDANGRSVDIEGIYTDPISVERTENFPINSNGTINNSFNPYEAEEIIVSKWLASKSIQVTRTSRAWSYPGYDDFIIYEYEIVNVTADTLKDVFAAWTYAFSPSMFGYERKFNKWAESSFRNNQFARFDLKRWMSYNVDRDGKPDTTEFFNLWSQSGNRGGLNAPQAVGMLVLNYDYNHLSTRDNTSLYVSADDAKSVWDENLKMKQPYLMRHENGNLYDGKLIQWYDLNSRKTGPFKNKTDTLAYPNDLFWIGRVKASYKLGFTQPVSHGYGFGPYIIPPGETVRFAIAEVVGYGAGVASDSVYKDLGGSTQGSQETGSGMHPVPSWYKELNYPEANMPVGSNYLNNHPLPWYVNPEVISIRDVADRAIQMYTGNPLIKYDTVQFDPKFTPVHGRYQVSVPIPAPLFRVEDTKSATNKLIWGAQPEYFNKSNLPQLHAPLSHYLVYRALDPLGAWSIADSIGRRDPRYWHDSVYIYFDTRSDIGVEVYYAVVSVDSLGGRSGISGMTNITRHETQSPIPDGYSLGKVYVIPNPVIVTNGRIGSSVGGEVTDQIGFVGLTKHCTIKIYSFSGQLINTLEHNANAFVDVSWFQISRNQQMIASGVYYFVVEDRDTGSRSKGKFVVIH